MGKWNRTGTVPGSWSPRRLAVLVLWAGIAAGGYFCGRHESMPAVAAEPAIARAVAQSTPPSELARHTLAYIYDSVPITREDLGEFLIARHGKDKLKQLINKRIIEQAAKSRGITVADAEVTATLNADALALNISTAQFVDTLLKRYNKTLFEWREDVIKPRLLLEKMSRARVSVTREDLAKAYEAYYGAKVQCQMIMWPKEEKNKVMHQIWPLIRDSEKEFDNAAKHQASASLASAGGHIKPVGRHTAGNDTLEAEMFKLKPGDVSTVIESEDGLVVVKCLKHIPPDTSASFEARRPALEREVFEKKVGIEVTKMFQELYAQAKPKNFLEPTAYDEQKERGFAPMKQPDANELYGSPAAGTLAPMGK